MKGLETRSNSAFFRKKNCRHSRASVGAQRTACRTEAQAGRDQRAGVLRLVLPEFPAVVASPESAVRMRHGGAVNLPEFSKAAIVRVFAGQRELLAIARRVAGTLFQPKVVLQG